MAHKQKQRLKVLRDLEADSDLNADLTVVKELAEANGIPQIEERASSTAPTGPLTSGDELDGVVSPNSRPLQAWEISAFKVGSGDPYDTMMEVKRGANPKSTVSSL